MFRVVRHALFVTQGNHSCTSGCTSVFCPICRLAVYLRIGVPSRNSAGKVNWTRNEINRKAETPAPVAVLSLLMQTFAYIRTANYFN